MGFKTASSFFTRASLAFLSTSEAVVATVGPLSPPGDTAAVFISWYYTYAPSNAGQNEVVTKLRRGLTITDPLLNNSLGVAVVPSQPIVLCGSWVDVVPGGANLFYSITSAPAGATGSTPQSEDVAMFAFIL